MNDILKRITSKLKFSVPFLFCYVDDVSTAIPKDEVEYTLQVFNSISEHIQFTIEVQSNQRINFLDITGI